MLIRQCYGTNLNGLGFNAAIKSTRNSWTRNKLPNWSVSQILFYKKSLVQCRTLLLRLWQQQNFKMSTKYECDKGSRKNGRNPFATSHDCHFMHISSFTQTLRNRLGTLGMPNINFWTGSSRRNEADSIKCSSFECLEFNVLVLDHRLPWSWLELAKTHIVFPRIVSFIE